MDAIVRLLREGPVDGVAPLAVLLDSLEAVGGPALIYQVIAALRTKAATACTLALNSHAWPSFDVAVAQAVHDLCACIAEGRAAAGGVALAALARAPQAYAPACSSLPLSCVTLLDCFSNPHGWARRDAASQGALPLFAGDGGLGALEQRLLGAAAAAAGDGGAITGLLAPRYLVLDGASQLVDAFGAASVAALLWRAQRAPGVAGVLCCAHADLHPPEAAAALQQGAASVLRVHPVAAWQRAVGGGGDGGGGWRPHGWIEVELRRRSGRVKSEARLFRVTSQGVEFRDATPPAAAPAPAAGAPAPRVAAAAPAAPPPPALAQQLAGGMRLELSGAEREAREAVRLPYEHQGQGSLYATHDYRDYLPPEAGGHGPGGGRLGHILYVRDSDSEEADSDEDPDDDLDI
jgi:hypothetical protein